MILAGLLSSWLLLSHSHQSIWLARIIIVLLTFIILFFTKENFIKDKTNKSNYHIFKFNFLKGLNFFYKNTNTRNIILGEFFATISLVGIGSIAIQKYLLESGLPASGWGFIYSLTAIIGIFIPLLAIKISNKFLNQKKYLIIIYILQLILYFSAALIISPVFAIILIFFHNCFEDAFNPVNSVFFQKEVPSIIRATLGSLKAASLGLAAFIGTIIAGYFACQLNGQLTIAILALNFIPAIIFYIKIKTPILQNK